MKVTRHKKIIAEEEKEKLKSTKIKRQRIELRRSRFAVTWVIMMGDFCETQALEILMVVTSK